MNADRIEWYANQLRGIPVADIPRIVRSVLLEATTEVRLAERERVARMFEESGIGGDHLAAAIRAMED